MNKFFKSFIPGFKFLLDLKA
jgi:hypothetical protein